MYKLCNCVMLLRQEILKRQRTLECARPRKAPEAAASFLPDCETQPVDLSPIAKKFQEPLRVEVQAPCELVKQQGAVAAEDFKMEDVGGSAAEPACGQPVDEQVKDLPETGPQEVEDLFEAELPSNFATRESQFAADAKPEDEQGEEGEQDDLPTADGKKKRGRKPGAKAKAKAKAKARAKAKAQAKRKAQAKPKPKAKAKSKGKAQAQAKPKTSSEDDAAEVSEESPDSSSSKRNGSKGKTSPEASPHEVLAPKPEKKEKASFARRYRPKDAFSGKRWDAIKSAFGLYILPHVSHFSKVEAQLLQCLLIFPER